MGYGTIYFVQHSYRRARVVLTGRPHREPAESEPPVAPNDEHGARGASASVSGNALRLHPIGRCAALSNVKALLRST